MRDLEAALDCGDKRASTMLLNILVDGKLAAVRSAEELMVK
jgi:hypothetical protein